MARIRTIKPEFFTSESVCSVSPLARLLFIGTWCEADRSGRLKWKPKTLKIRYLPVDSCDINKLAQELISEEMIEIYTVDGADYCQIPAFESHQVINNRESESKLPAKPADYIDASSTRESGDKAEGRKEGKGRERKGKEGKGTGVDTPKEALDFSFITDSQDQIEEIKRIRKANKGGNITQRVISGLATQFQEAAKKGWSLEDCLTEWETRGWKSFKAEWLDPKVNSISGRGMQRRIEGNLLGMTSNAPPASPIQPIQPIQGILDGEIIDHE